MYKTFIGYKKKLSQSFGTVTRVHSAARGSIHKTFLNDNTCDVKNITYSYNIMVYSLCYFIIFFMIRVCLLYGVDVNICSVHIWTLFYILFVISMLLLLRATTIRIIYTGAAYGMQTDNTHTHPSTRKYIIEFLF